jgi:hypothetical protein
MQSAFKEQLCSSWHKQAAFSSQIRCKLDRVIACYPDKVLIIKMFAANKIRDITIIAQARIYTNSKIIQPLVVFVRTALLLKDSLVLLKLLLITLVSIEEPTREVLIEVLGCVEFRQQKVKDIKLPLNTLLVIRDI